MHTIALIAPSPSHKKKAAPDGRLTLDDAFWSYQAAWAVGKVPVCSNTRLEKITNKYWGPLLKRGRAIVRANGRYEWVGEKPNKQPYHIHRKDRELLYIAALGNFSEAIPEQHKAATGFTLVTADAVWEGWWTYMTVGR